MSCQEVMELVQRYLDRDLNDDEYRIMMAHVDECPECALMFERFRRLSDDLAALPDVSPPVSLVDAILPQLDEIDRLGAGVEHAEAAAQDVPDHSARRMPNARPSRRLRDQLSLRVLGGVVAAGIVIGLFITKFPPGAMQMHSAGESTEMSTASSSADSAADSSASSNSAAAPDSASSNTASRSAEKKFVADSSASRASQSDDGAKTSNDAKLDAAPAGGATADSGSDSEADSNSPMKLRTTDQYGANMQQGPAQDTNNPQAQTKSNDMGLAPTGGANTGGADSDGAAPEQDATGPEANADGSGAQKMSIMAPPVAEPTYPSPDHAYVATISQAEDGSRQVVIRDDGQKVVFQSERYEVDQIANVTWSDDGKYLMYDLTTGDDAQHVKVDVQLGAVVPNDGN